MSELAITNNHALEVLNDLVDVLSTELENHYWKKLDKQAVTDASVNEDDFISELVDKHIVATTRLTAEELDALLHGELEIV